MNESQIDRILVKLRQIALPPAPDLRREVRAKIALLKNHPSFWQRVLPVLHWNELLVQPRIAACALALALAVGTIPGAVLLAVSSRADDARNARVSLHLGVFDSSRVSFPDFATAVPSER